MRSLCLLLLLAVLFVQAPARAQSLVPAEEQRLYAMVNAARSERGLPALERVASLDGLAREHSGRMLREGRIFHNLGL